MPHIYRSLPSPQQHPCPTPVALTPIPTPTLNSQLSTLTLPLSSDPAHELFGSRRCRRPGFGLGYRLRDNVITGLSLSLGQSPSSPAALTLVLIQGAPNPNPSSSPNPGSHPRCCAIGRAVYSAGYCAQRCQGVWLTSRTHVGSVSVAPSHICSSHASLAHPWSLCTHSYALSQQ